VGRRPGRNVADATARAPSVARVHAWFRWKRARRRFRARRFFDAFYFDLRDAAKPAAEISVTYFLSRGDPLASVPFWSKQYQRRVPIDGSSTEKQAAALSSAFAEIAAELATDLAAVNLQKP
jgi:hypothetical protein